MFWRSVDLTGNQTAGGVAHGGEAFWRSVDLTGNQTKVFLAFILSRFGAVSI